MEGTGGSREEHMREDFRWCFVKKCDLVCGEAAFVAYLSVSLSVHTDSVWCLSHGRALALWHLFTSTGSQFSCPQNSFHEPGVRCSMRSIVSVYDPKSSSLQKVSQSPTPRRQFILEEAARPLNVACLGPGVYAGWEPGFMCTQVFMVTQWAEISLPVRASFMLKSKKQSGYCSVLLIFSCCFWKRGIK